MADTFKGFTPKAATFFRQLAKNNDRAWFATHKETYQREVHEPMLTLVTLLCDDLRRVAADYVPAKPASAIYRIYRDTRFSKDKTPYKDHTGANFQHRRIEKNRGAGLYFQFAPSGLGIAGGLYMPEPEHLLAVRQRLAAEHEAFRALCANPKLQRQFGKLEGEQAARVPKGFDADSPAADLLRRKQLYFWHEFDVKLAYTPRLRREILTRFELLLPVVEFLNSAILADLGTEEDLRPKRPEPMF